jgi:hypothetical protein
MLYNFRNNSKCHLEQGKRDIFETLEPTYKMSKQRFIQVCSLLSLIPRFTPFFALFDWTISKEYKCTICFLNIFKAYVLKNKNPFYKLKTI